MRHSVVELDLARFTQNVHAIHDALPDGCELVQVIKADAYGHGVEHIAPAALSAGVRAFSVAHADEAFQLRRLCGEGVRIILLGVSDPVELADLVQEDVELMIPDLATLKLYEEVAVESEICIRAHVKVDTGMGRFGVLWTNARGLVEKIQASRHVEPVGLCSHFSSADENADFSAVQLDRFRELLRELDGCSFFRHMANTAGFQHVSGSDFDGIRVGLGLLGYDSGQGSIRADTQPVLSWSTTIAQIRELPEGATVGYGSTFVAPRSLRVAVCNIGYADGFPRRLSSDAYVLVHGRRCRVLGRVSMNWITVDVTDCHKLAVGDPVCLIGASGDEVLTAADLAGWADTIVYDVLTGIRPVEVRARSL